MCFFLQESDVRKMISAQSIIFIKNPTVENRCWAMCFFHWKSGVKKWALGIPFFFIINQKLENQKTCKPDFRKQFFSSEIRHQKSDDGYTCFFRWKSNVRKPTSGQHVFSSRFKRQKTDVEQMCFFHQKSDVRTTSFFHWEKRKSGQRFFFIGNPMLG